MRVFLLILTGLLSAGLAVARAQSGAARGMEPGMARARASLDAGRIGEAVTLYDHVISRFPASSEAHLQKAFALEKLGKHEQAIAEYETALRLAPKDPRALNNLGFLLVDRGIDVPRGEKLLGKAIALAPDFAPAYDSLGWAEYRKKNFARAETLLREAIRRDPRSSSAYFHAGVMTLKRGDYARSAAYLRRLVDLEPAHVKGLIGLGMAHARLGQKDAARQTLTRALGLVDRDSPPGQEILRLLNELGPYFPGTKLQHYLAGSGSAGGTGGGPMSAWEPRAAQERPGTTADGLPAMAVVPGIGRQQAGVAALRGLPGAAASPSASAGPRIQLHKQADDAPPAPGDTGRSGRASTPVLGEELLSRHLALAALYEEQGLYQDARGELHTVINLSPASPQARAARDRLPGLEGHPEPSSDVRLAGYLEMGETLAARRADDEAILQYQKVVLADATNPVANKALGFLYLRRGDESRALGHVETALEREPRYLEALVLKGFIEARRRQFDRSRQTFERARDLAPEGSEVSAYAEDMSRRMSRLSALK